MVQPKSPPRSIRPGTERDAHIQAWATDHGLTLHAATLALIDLGLDRAVIGPEESRLLQELRALASGPERMVRVVDDGAPAFVALTASEAFTPEAGETVKVSLPADVRGFAADGTPIKRPAFVSRPKTGKPKR